MFYREYDRDYNREGASIIIAARNEEENILRFLPDIINQDYTDFEIIFVNDASTDQTAAITDKLAKENLKLKVIHLSESLGKKNAVQKAIEVAKFDILVFTDADCKPASKTWLAETVSRFENDTQIVLGYGAYEKSKGFLNKLIRFDTVWIAVQYFGFALMKNPYMGVGRNLAYRKSLFNKVGGFKTHLDLASGDDDLFIRDAANEHNTQICIDPNAFTYSPAKADFNSWIHQKTRHLSAGYRYKKGINFFLNMIYWSVFLFYISSAILLVMGEWPRVLFFYIMILIYNYLIYFHIFKKLNEKDLTPLLPILEIIHIFACFLIGIKSISGAKIKWK